MPVEPQPLSLAVAHVASARAAACGAAESLADRLHQHTQISPLDSTADCVRLLRHLSETRLEPPVWRRGRPHLLLEGATCDAPPAAAEGAPCRLHIDAYVRSVPLSPNQLVTVPGAGDFALESIRAAPELVPAQGSGGVPPGQSTEDLPVLAVPDERRCGSVPFGGALSAGLESPYANAILAASLWRSEAASRAREGMLAAR